MTVPIIVLFFLAQRTFIQGITLTGIKVKREVPHSPKANG